jgi:predicted dehydrogenase
MSPARIRVGIVGCGLIAQVMHLPHLRELTNLYEVAAVCDLSSGLAQRVAADYGIAQHFQNWQDMLSGAHLDAVLLLSSGSHAPAAIAACQAGLHVFTEKPMSLSSIEGQAMVDAASAAGKHLMVGYMKRYDPAYVRLEDELASRDDIRLIRVTTLESAIEPYVAHLPLHRGVGVPHAVLAQMRADDERRVDQALGQVSPEARHAFRWILLDSLVHELNALRGVLGEPDAVEYAALSPRNVTLVLTFDAVQCVLSWVDLPGIARYQQEFAFYSPQRRLTLTFPSPFLRNMPTELTLDGGDVGTPRSWRTVETASYEEAFKRELIEFHSSLTQDREPKTSGLDGLNDVKLCEAIVAAYEARGQ